MEWLTVILWILFMILSLRSWRKDRCGFDRIEASTPGDAATLSETEVAAIVDKYTQDNRMVGDFVLTKAAFPFGSNTILPVEGFSMDEVRDEVESYYMITAAVSAEKIWNIVLDFIGLLGDFVQMAVLDKSSKTEVINYLSSEMEVCLLLGILQQHRNFLINDASVEMCLLSQYRKMELYLDSFKHLRFRAEDAGPIVDLLHDYRIFGKQQMQFFPQGQCLLLHDTDCRVQMKALLDKLHIVQTSFYNNEKT